MSCVWNEDQTHDLRGERRFLWLLDLFVSTIPLTFILLNSIRKGFSSGVWGFGCRLNVITGLFMVRSGFSLFTNILLFITFMSATGKRQTILRKEMQNWKIRIKTQRIIYRLFSMSSSHDPVMRMFHCLFIVLKISLFPMSSSHDLVIRMFRCLFIVLKIPMFPVSYLGLLMN